MSALVLDTCVIVAAVRSRAGASYVLVEWAMRGDIETVLTVPLIYQYEEVLSRPEHGLKGWTQAAREAFLDALMAPARLVKPYFSLRPALEDSGDELVLEAAIAGNADIVTFDVRHFAPASRFGVAIFTPGGILRKLDEEGELCYGEE
jgi:predicted nucleic acid-binding protein